MKFFLDTAKREGNPGGRRSWGLLDGVTTNPSLRGQGRAQL